MNRHGLTLVQTLLAVTVSLVLFVFMLTSLGRTGCGARSIKDANQVHQVMQSLVTWSLNNKDLYPIPSLIDRNDLTVRGPGADGDPAAHSGKDNTGNLLSVLIWNGLITPTVCVSPAEMSPVVREDEQYEMKSPKSCALDGGSGALWDPGFSGTADAAEGQGDAANTSRRMTGTSNNSFAHALMLSGVARSRVWKNNWNATEGIFGNRGPVYSGTVGNDAAPSPAAGVWKPIDGPLSTSSITLLIHGSPRTWKGNIGYNDTHVGFETRPDPAETTYRARIGTGTTVRADNMFVDESDEDNGVAGSTPAIAFMQNTNNWLRPVARVLGVTGTDGKPSYTITRWVD